MATGPVSVTLDAKSIARAKLMLERYRGKPLQTRVNKGLLSAGRILVPAIRAAAPVLTGATQRSVKARMSRKSGLGLQALLVGPTVRHAPPLIRGHRLVAWGNETGRTVPGNPFVDEAVSPRVRDAVIAVVRELQS